MQIGFNMDDSGLDKIRSNTSCRQPASGELAYSASLRQVHSSALHQAPAVPLTQQHRLLTMSRTPVYCPSDDRAPPSPPIFLRKQISTLLITMFGWNKLCSKQSLFSFQILFYLRSFFSRRNFDPIYDLRIEFVSKCHCENVDLKS